MALPTTGFTQTGSSSGPSSSYGFGQLPQPGVSSYTPTTGPTAQGSNVNYFDAANAQSGADRNAALFNSGINRPDQSSAYGSQNWQLRPGADPSNPQPGDYILNTSLNQNEQGILGQQEGLTSNYLGAIGNMGQTPDFSGAPGLNSSVGSNVGDAARQRVQDALFGNINQQYDRLDSQARARMMASGNDLGSQGYNDEMTQIGNQRAQAYNDATLTAGQEQSRMLNDAISSGNFSNSARQQYINQLLQQRNQPLNELNAMRTGATVNNFNPTNVPQIQGAQPAPYMDAAIATGNQQMDYNKMKQSGTNAMLGGLAGMGSAALTANPGLPADVWNAIKSGAGNAYDWMQNQWANGPGFTPNVTAPDYSSMIPDGSGIPI